MPDIRESDELFQTEEEREKWTDGQEKEMEGRRGTFMLKREEEIMNLMMLLYDTVYLVYQMLESQTVGYLLNFNNLDIYDTIIFGYYVRTVIIIKINLSG